MIRVLPDPDAVARGAAERVIQAADEAIGARRAFRIALSGGTSPRRLCRLLATPGFRARCDWSRAVILFGTDKGLCGALNSNLFRAVMQFDPATTVFIAAGKRAAQFIARTDRQLAAEFTFADTPRFAEARPMVGFARDLFLKGDVDQVLIVATRFINTLVQEPAVVEFLPIGEIKGLTIPDTESDGDLAVAAGEVLFELSAETVLGYLFGHYLNIYVYRVMLEAKASEQSARMVAMKNATDNANQLIKDLTLEYNKLRQANITKELLEIASAQLGNA